VGSAGMVGDAISGLSNSIGNVADVLVQRDTELKKQKQDSILIEKGSQITDDILNFEMSYEKENKGINAAGSQEKVAKYTSTLFDKYRVEDDEVVNNKLKQHIAAHDQGLKTKLAGFEASELKNYATDVRVLDFETSKKMAQTGDVSTAVVNYKKTLETQKNNYSLSPEDYQIELKKGVSGIYESYINELIIKDPVSAGKVFEVAKPELLTDTQERLEKVLTPAVTMRQGSDVGTEVFKTDTSGKLEIMTDAVRAKKLAPEAEKFAINQVKELYNERKIDTENANKAVFDDAYAILTKKSLEGDGRLNSINDIPQTTWAKMMSVDPKTTMQIQNHISTEQRQQANINKAEVREAKKEQRLQQAENESSILIADDFATRDLKKELATGKINSTQYIKLLTAQQKLDPVKRDSVKQALSKINTGTSLKKALNGGDANDLAIWKNKYSDLVKAFAYKNADDPNFDNKLSEFVEKRVLSDMVTSWFAGDEADRIAKFNAAKAESGELPQKRKTDKKPITKEEAIAELKRRGKM